MPIFTPGQKEEALQFFKVHGVDFPDENTDQHIGMYFELKSMKFDLKPIEFVVGIEYKNKKAVINGEEAVNITMNNPHKIGEYDVMAYQILIECFNRLKQ